MKKRPDQSPGGARKSESPQQAPVDVSAQPPETNGGPNEVRHRDRCHGEPRAGVEGEKRRQQAADAEPADRRNGAGCCGDGKDEDRKQRNAAILHDGNSNQKPTPTVTSMRRAVMR
jgi:hypothetical protein